MKLTTPKGYKGDLEVDALYKFGGPENRFSINNTGNATATIAPKWKSSELLEIFLDVEYELIVKPSAVLELDFPPAGKGRFGYSATWNVTFTDTEMKLVPDGKQPRTWGAPSQKGDVVIKPTTVAVATDGSGVKWTARMDVDLSLEYEDKGVGVGPVTVGDSKGSMQIGFAIQLIINMEKPPAPKKPVVPAKPEPVKIKKQTLVVGSFEFGEYAVNKIKSASGMLDYSKLSGWYDKLPEATKTKILNGEPPGGKKIIMTGFTDNVGDEHLNFDLGRKRALAVAEAFEKISGVAWEKFVATPSKGEQDVRQENKKLEKKEPKYRRVEVTIHVEE